MSANYLIHEARERVHQHGMYKLLVRKKAWFLMNDPDLDTYSLEDLEAIVKSLDLLLQVQSLETKHMSVCDLDLNLLKAINLTQPQSVDKVIQMFRNVLTLDRVVTYTNQTGLDLIINCRDLMIKLPILEGLSPKQIRIATSMIGDPQYAIGGLVEDRPFMIARSAYEDEVDVIMSTVHQKVHVAILEYLIFLIWTGIWSSGLYWLVKSSSSFLHIDLLLEHNIGGAGVAYGVFLFQFVAIYVVMATLIGSRLIAGNHYLTINRYAHIIFPGYKDKYGPHYFIEFFWNLILMWLVLTARIPILSFDRRALYYAFIIHLSPNIFQLVILSLVSYRTIIFDCFYCFFLHPAWRLHAYGRSFAHKLVSLTGVW